MALFRANLDLVFDLDLDLDHPRVVQRGSIKKPSKSRTKSKSKSTNMASYEG
jgi:hypothetical protein